MRRWDEIDKFAVEHPSSSSASSSSTAGTTVAGVAAKGKKKGKGKGKKESRMQMRKEKALNRGKKGKKGDSLFGASKDDADRYADTIFDIVDTNPKDGTKLFLMVYGLLVWVFAYTTRAPSPHRHQH